MSKEVVRWGEPWESRYSQGDIKKLMEENMSENRGSRENGETSGSVTVTSTPNIWFGPPVIATTKYHQVKIDKVANGFIVEIGCKKFVAEKWDVLAKKLAEYWDDPAAAEKKYVK
jgi:hypothetical protein